MWSDQKVLFHGALWELFFSYRNCRHSRGPHKQELVVHVVVPSHGQFNHKMWPDLELPFTDAQLDTDYNLFYDGLSFSSWSTLWYRYVCWSVQEACTHMETWHKMLQKFAHLHTSYITHLLVWKLALSLTDYNPLWQLMLIFPSSNSKQGIISTVVINMLQSQISNQCEVKIWQTQLISMGHVSIIANLQGKTTIALCWANTHSSLGISMDAPFSGLVPFSPNWI